MTVLIERSTDDVLASAPPIVHDWLTAHSSQRETLRAYRAGIALWLTWCHRNDANPVGADRAACDRYATWLTHDTIPRTGQPRQARTRARLIATVASLYDYLEDADLIERNPTRKVHRPKVAGDGTTPALSASESRRLLAAAEASSPLTHLAVSTLLATGVRAAGLLALDVEHLRIEDGRLVATVTLKGGEPLALPLPDGAADVVDRIRGERTSGPLLAGTRGRWSYDALHEAVVKCGEAASLPLRVTPHVLRATWATIALSAGVSPAYVQSVLGHSNIATTLKYDRRRHDLQRRADAMDAVAAKIRDAA